MSVHINSTATVILAILGVCSGGSFIYFISRARDLPRGMTYRLIARRVCLIFLLVFAVVGITTPSGSLWQRGTFDAMLFFVFAYLAFPVYAVATLLMNGIRRKMAGGPQPQ